MNSGKAGCSRGYIADLMQQLTTREQAVHLEWQPLPSLKHSNQAAHLPWPAQQVQECNSSHTAGNA